MCTDLSVITIIGTKFVAFKANSSNMAIAKGTTTAQSLSQNPSSASVELPHVQLSNFGFYKYKNNNN